MTQQSPQPAPQPTTYADVFDLTLSPYGASFRFGISGPVDQKTGTQQIELNGRVLMSLEHLKALGYVVHREVLRHEKKMGVLVALPDQIITQLLYPMPPGLPPEAQENYVATMRPIALKEWAAFWKQEQPTPQAASPNGAADDTAKALARV